MAVPPMTTRTFSKNSVGPWVISTDLTTAYILQSLVEWHVYLWTACFQMVVILGDHVNSKDIKVIFVCPS